MSFVVLFFMSSKFLTVVDHFFGVIVSIMIHSSCSDLITHLYICTTFLVKKKKKKKRVERFYFILHIHRSVLLAR